MMFLVPTETLHPVCKCDQDNACRSSSLSCPVGTRGHPWAGRLVLASLPSFGLAVGLPITYTSPFAGPQFVCEPRRIRTGFSATFKVYPSELPQCLAQTTHIFLEPLVSQVC